MLRQLKQDTSLGESVMEVALYKVQQSSDQYERCGLIERYIPFIVKQVSLNLGRYVTSESDETYIIGLEAFNEAIDRYDAAKGSFLNLAAIVIKSRIQDYQRKEVARLGREVLMDPQDSEMVNIATKEHFEEIVALKEEIEILTRTLNDFDLTLSDVAEQSPVHGLTRHTLLQYCRQFVLHHQLVEKLFKSKQIPIKESVDQIAISRKQIKSHRAYVIAVIVVIHKKLQTMADYLKIEGAKHD